MDLPRLAHRQLQRLKNSALPSAATTALPCRSTMSARTNASNVRRNLPNKRAGLRERISYIGEPGQSEIFNLSDTLDGYSTSGIAVWFLAASFLNCHFLYYAFPSPVIGL